jgi:hypothetical protein
MFIQKIVEAAAVRRLRKALQVLRLLREVVSTLNQVFDTIALLND